MTTSSKERVLVFSAGGPSPRATNATVPATAINIAINSFVFINARAFPGFMDVQSPVLNKGETGINNRPRGHTTGGKEESDQVAAIPLIERCGSRRTKDGLRRKRDGFNCGLRKKLNRSGGQKLQIVLRSVLRGDGRQSAAGVRPIFDHAAFAFAMLAMTAAFRNPAFLGCEICFARHQRCLRDDQRDAKQDGEQAFH